MLPPSDSPTHSLSSPRHVTTVRLTHPPTVLARAPQFRVNFGTQPFYCSDFNYITHGCGRTLRDPNDDESDAESEAPDSEGGDDEDEDAAEKENE
jgi:hypothetical protein